MSTSQISEEATSARENARDARGRFSPHPSGESQAKLETMQPVSDDHSSSRTAHAASLLSDRFGPDGVTVEQVGDHHIAIGDPDQRGNAPLALVNEEDAWEVRDPDVRGEVVDVIDHGADSQAEQAAERAYLRYTEKMGAAAGR